MTNEQALETIKLALDLAARKGAFGLQDFANILEALKIIDPSIVVDPKQEADTPKTSKK